MKNRYPLFMMGAALMLVGGCHSQPSSSSQAPRTSQNPAQSDNEDEDGDDGAYGSNDTSASLGEVDGVSPENPTYLTAETADPSGLLDQAIEHVAMALAGAVEPEEGETTSLESVSAVEISTEIVLDGSSQEPRSE